MGLSAKVLRVFAPGGPRGLPDPIGCAHVRTPGRARGPAAQLLLARSAPAAAAAGLPVPVAVHVHVAVDDSWMCARLATAALRLRVCCSARASPGERSERSCAPSPGLRSCTARVSLLLDGPPWARFWAEMRTFGDALK